MVEAFEMTEADMPLYSLTGTSNAAALNGPFGRRHLCMGNGAAGFDRILGNAPARHLGTRNREKWLFERGQPRHARAIKRKKIEKATTSMRNEKVRLRPLRSRPGNVG